MAARRRKRSKPAAPPEPAPPKRERRRARQAAADGPVTPSAAEEAAEAAAVTAKVIPDILSGRLTYGEAAESVGIDIRTLERRLATAFKLDPDLRQTLRDGFEGMLIRTLQEDMWLHRARVLTPKAVEVMKDGEPAGLKIAYDDVATALRGQHGAMDRLMRILGIGAERIELNDQRSRPPLTMEELRELREKSPEVRKALEELA